MGLEAQLSADQTSLTIKMDDKFDFGKVQSASITAYN